MGGFPDGYHMWEDTHPLIHDLVAPGVEVHCLYGTGIDTAERLIYSKTMPTGKATILMGDGDGTVNVRSLSACTKWAIEQKQPVYVRAQNVTIWPCSTILLLSITLQAYSPSVDLICCQKEMKPTFCFVFSTIFQSGKTTELICVGYC